MKQFITSLLFSAGVALTATTAFACEPFLVEQATLRKPIELHTDGSFRVMVADRNFTTAASDSGGYISIHIEGGKAYDIGAGRVGQKVSESSGCFTNERLLVVDCASERGIMIDGMLDPKWKGYDVGATSIALIQYPMGPIALRKNTTLDDLEQLAKLHRFKYTLDVAGEAEKFKRNQRYDPYMGCKIFYPDSIGASG